MSSMKRNVLGACTVNALFPPVSPPSFPFGDWSRDSLSIAISLTRCALSELLTIGRLDLKVDN